MATYRALIALILLVVAGWCMFRDYQREKQMTCDLQNRVIGARLQKEGVSPYFYKWKQGDGPRYYDPTTWEPFKDSLKVSNITASPFFHDLLIPIANLPQRTISRIWLLIEYLMLLVCIAVALKLSSNDTQRWLVIAVTVLFMLTDAWIAHIALGQMYIMIPMLAFLFYYFINRTSSWSAAIAGLCAITMVLVKPNTMVFLLPFSILLVRHASRYRFVFLIPVVVLAGWTIASAQQRYFWLDYRKNIAEHVKVFQELQPQKQVNDPDPHYAAWEGWDRKEMAAATKKYPIPFYTEIGNFYIVINKTLHTKISVPLLNVLCIASLVLMTALFFILYKKKNQLSPPPIQIALLGYCLYMLTDLFSPVGRNQYSTVQWLFPLLLAAARFTPRLRWPWIFLAVGLFMNMINPGFMKMEHTIGEYIILAVFGWLTFSGMSPDKPPKLFPNNP